MSEAGLQYLYRYRHLQGGNREYTSRIITDSVLHFASPTQFNDPFDCKVHFQTSISLDGLRRKYEEQIQKFSPNLNIEQRKAKVAQDIERMNPDGFLEHMTRNLQMAVDRAGVLSLSASDRNVLLWSHYSAGHSGLCLKFLATDSTPLFGEAQPVQYSPEYPNVLLQDPPEKQVESFLLTKALDWEYEKEWRIIDTDSSGEKVFPEELLVGVILGSCMLAEEKDYIVNLVRQRKYPVKIYQASVNKGSFSLNIDSYEF
jgi:hypothetical protein